MTNNSKVLLKVRNVKKYFNTPSGVVKAIDDVSFDVKQGEIVGLIGESGSGKTTVGRCLIRLYEGYSGFVSLNDQAISGSKLNKRKKMFLNQNMQMIFQDPHASLNGQQNIYTILKEPLIVNKIMKQEYDDLFLDWEDVKSNFKYTFNEELKKIELDTMIYHTQQAQTLLDEWSNVIERIKFKYVDIENDFNQYFAFKLTCQEREGNVISKNFMNNSKILDLYFKCQGEFRNDSILLIEQELKKRKQDYLKVKALSRMSAFEIKKRKLLLDKERELKRLQIIKNNIISAHKSIINSYVKEFKNSYLSHKEHAWTKTNYEEYNKIIRMSLLSKKMYSDLVGIKRKIIYLQSSHIDEMINKFKRYRDELMIRIENEFKPTSIKNYESELKKFIKNEFNFDFRPYSEISLSIGININKNIKDLKTDIDRIYWTYSSDKANNIPGKKPEDVESAKKSYLELEHIYEKENHEYEKDFNQRLKQYEFQIRQQKEKLNSIRLELSKIETLFEEKHKEFLSGLKSHLKQKGESRKQIKNHLSIYENKVKLKNETLESFNVEVLNLKKDLIKLKHLVGIISSRDSKKHIKKILIKEKIYRSLEEVGLLRQFAWRYPHEFSGGQRQRIVIARALISNPKVIIADEPIASLDVSIQAQVVNILKELCEKKNVSLIFIAHDLSMVEYIADKILIMHLGKIVEFGKTEEIYSNPIHPYTVNLFKSVPKISNANDKFKSSNFELDYLEQQTKTDAHVDFYQLNDDHIVYSTAKQFWKWTQRKPKISAYTKNPSILDT